ncbi:MAG: glycosyltransferase [Halioglobus sp.]|nr:glycosyltransferase [Halioglobus sp.]
MLNVDGAVCRAEVTMAVYESSPFFSIIIPTRNRPALLQRALESVKSQTFGDREILVVVDGSNDEYLKRYRDMDAHSEDISFVYLAHRSAGHGQSYSMNVGVDHSTGGYLCFLDDDDVWTDDFYLETVHASITASDQPVDLHYSNQKAFYSDGSTTD